MHDGKGFGESEFWFSMVKVIAIIAFIIIGIAMIIKIMMTPCSTFGNWTYKDAPFVGGLQAMIGVAMIAGFSFQGTEMVGVAAGESKDPKKTIPLQLNRFSGEFYYSISCVFSSSVHYCL
jgi:lysine-specific permease